MKELISTYLETSKERIKNPFIGAFFISWIVINWKPIIFLLFSDEKIEDKILVIEQKYTSINNGLYYPIVIALIYVVALPYFMWLLEELLKKSTKGRKNNVINQLIVDIQGKQKLAVEESKLEDLKASYREKADLNNKIELLQNQLDERETTIKQYLSEIETLKEAYSNLELLVDKNENSDISNPEYERLKQEFLKFKESDMYEYFRETGISIRNQSNFPNSLNEIIKEKFIFNDIVEKKVDNENQVVYYDFTDKGKFFWKEYVMNIKVVKKQNPKFRIDPDDDLPF